MTNKKKIILTIAVLSAIIVSFMGGQSFSKYVSQVKGEGQVEVAKWSFLVNGNEEVINTIDLLSTCDNETLLNHKVAPGTKGTFRIEIDATGAEVGIDYEVHLKEKSQKPRNLVFKYNNAEYTTVEELEDALTGTIFANNANKRVTLPIEWEWKYETGNTPEEILAEDKEDTTDGKTITNYTFDIIVTGTQMVPAE